MIIREATNEDTLQIIAVLRASLGESKLPKSKKIWEYKHFENPFGKSLILVAEEDNKILGVRAFMKWQWHFKNEAFSAFRAVDTATHPKHQGKGIFKKLTLRAIEIGKERGDHFIFNTPNSQSLPGYLKMGWIEVSKLPIQLIPVNPLSWLQSKNENLVYNIAVKNEGAGLPDLLNNYTSRIEQKDKLFTLKTVDYLQWRYHNNPLQQYEIKSDQDFYIAAYIKKHNKFQELRIVEHIYNNNQGLLKIKKSVKEFLKKFNCQVITASPDLNLGLGFSGKFGPIVTIRDVKINNEDFKKISDIKKWSYHLGDLELF